jgi:SAM-dependent methyltransferase
MTTDYSPIDDAARLALQAHLTETGDHAILDPLLTRLRSEGRVRVLDAGCGTGVVTLSRFRDVEVLGIDRDPGAIAAARTRSRNLTGYSFEVADIEDLGARTFDLVFTALTLHLVADPTTSIIALWRAVRPGGYLVVRGLDDGLTIVDPLTDDATRANELLPKILPAVNRFHGRRLTSQLLALPGAADVSYHAIPISTTHAPGLAGRVALFDVLYGWQRPDVVGSPDSPYWPELLEVLARERERFIDEPVFAAAHLPIVSAHKTI